ncbi:hypothetical protein AAEU42_13205 [Pseudoflavonifractor phocaeensis]
MNYKGKRVKPLTREEKRLQQKAEAWIKGLAALALILCVGIGLGRWVL